MFSFALERFSEADSSKESNGSVISSLRDVVLDGVVLLVLEGRRYLIRGFVRNPKT